MAQKKRRPGPPKKKAAHKSVGVSVSFPPTLLRRLRKLANAEGLSLSGLLAREMQRVAGRLEKRGER